MYKTRRFMDISNFVSVSHKLAQTKNKARNRMTLENIIRHHPQRAAAAFDKRKF